MKSCVAEESDGATEQRSVACQFHLKSNETHAGFRVHGSSERSDSASMPKGSNPRTRVRKASMDSYMYMYVTVSRKNDVLEEVSIG
jgi:hypothetical protein